MAVRFAGYFEDEECEVDPFCCCDVWDDICADQAGEICYLTRTCGRTAGITRSIFRTRAAWPPRS